MMHFQRSLLILLVLFGSLGCSQQPTAVQPGAVAPATPAGPQPQAVPAIAPFAAEAWTSRSIYFIMTDRFANGDTSNDNAHGINRNLKYNRGWHGGDFQGIISRLDYIKDMGFNAIWITPVTLQRSTAAYHGYHTYDFYQIDGHFGGMEALKQLVAEAHRRDIWVMIDVVANHTGDFQFEGSNLTAAAPFDNPDWYHQNGGIENWDDQNELETHDLFGLDDLAQEKPEVRAELLNWIRWLKAETGLDGLRVDTARHMPRDFLAEFDQAADTFSLGEAWNADPAYVAQYSHALDATVDFPLYLAVFGENSDPVPDMQRVFAQDASYRNAATNGVFVDNHDLPRIGCLIKEMPPEQGTALVRAALGMIFSVRGIPIVYYGTEQGFDGCVDPANREDMFDNLDPQAPLISYLRTLNQLRRNHPALQYGAQLERGASATAYGFQRIAGTDHVVVCLNTSSEPQTLALSGLAGLPDGLELQNQLREERLLVQAGSLNCELQPFEIKILIP